MAKRKIGIITTSFPRHPEDPAGQFVLGMARGLSKKGVRVEVVVPEPPGDHRWGKGDWLGSIRVFPAPYARPASLQRLFFGAGVLDNLSDPWLGLLAIPAVASMWAVAVGRSRGWDRVVSHWLLPSAVIAGVLGRRIPHLAVAHSGDVHLLGKAPLGRIFKPIIARGCERMWFVSRQLMREFEAAGRSGPGPGPEMEVVYLGVDPDELRCPEGRDSLRAELGLEGFAVLFLGRLVPIKGVDVLLEAIRGIDGTDLVIAGDGPEREKLEALARTAAPRALFTGVVGARERARLMKACDVLVVPSRPLASGRHEGLPVVITEAMASRLPVIASRTGGIAELVRDGETGLLVKPSDPAGLGEAICRLRDDPPLRSRIVEGASRWVSGRTWDRFCEHSFFG